MTGIPAGQSTVATVRARVIALVLILLSYGAVGARQPAVRTSVPLPVPATELAKSLGLDPGDRSQLLISIVRLVFDAPDGLSVEDQKRRTTLMAQLRASPSARGDRVPLPLDVSIWRETLLPRPTDGREIAAAIFSDRSTALLYHGLAALDDDTLGWLGPDRDTLLHLRRHAGVFTAFGRSIKVRGTRVAVPGGARAEAVWTAVVGADPARAGAFVQRLIRGNGRLAWLYDTVQHLDPNRQRFVFGPDLTEAEQIDRLRRLLTVFEAAAPEWQMPERPFVRPTLDPSLVLSLVLAKPDGTLLGPNSRRIWEAVFREDAAALTAAGTSTDAEGDNAPLEPAWLARRISLVPSTIGKRRLETFLFGQRVFSDPPRDEATLLSALRGAAAFPALALTLERIGITRAAAHASAARLAAALNAIGSADWRRVSIAEFQSALAIIDRATRMNGLGRESAAALVSSLTALPVSIEYGFGSAFRKWLQLELARALPLHADSAEPMEEAVLFACAGGTENPRPLETVEWEGRRYGLNPAAGELKRLRLIRLRQRATIRGVARAATSLDARLAAVAGTTDGTQLPMEQALAETLTSIAYAAYLGEAEGAAASAGDVAHRHDFGFAEGSASGQSAAWRIPREERSDRRGWRLVGSLLGLDVALARLALRHLDTSDMPGEPTTTTADRTSFMLTAALMSPLARANEARDEIAAAISRGRTRVAALPNDRSELEAVAEDAGLSEWRREAIGWTAEHEPHTLVSRFSLVELFWLGSQRSTSSRALDGWGTATFMLDGCLCLRMPDRTPWESRTGRAATGHLATRGADVAMRVAEVLAELGLPGALAPAIVAYAMQDVVDLAQPAFFDDWGAFQRTARDLPRDRVIDYISAVAADGVLIPLSSDSAR